MAKSVTPFLMFEGKAQEALDLYMRVLPNSEVVSMQKYGPEGPGPEGTIMHAIVTLVGQQVMVSDSHVQHAFTFTPSISFWVECNDEAELERLFDELGKGGQVYMPLDHYGFSTRFGWVGDRFGVTWQLNLA
ncbi:VOC family protein [Pelagibacterium sp. 26DY04]|uniref:VOC family protein n=1 Tax=Pelagibacterium sp. 26DY04 TaxID=2967130 RepID=UPI0028155E51|nr:VOC family protein [Pelagibacterium sp. 26DY04]WMT88593.1 VOC family protein [Pelagibacterium sp. 26DY04]